MIPASQSGAKVVPDPEHRPSIESVIADVETQEWYEGQMMYNKIFDPKEAQVGEA